MDAMALKEFVLGLLKTELSYLRILGSSEASYAAVEEAWSNHQATHMHASAGLVVFVVWLAVLHRFGLMCLVSLDYGVAYSRWLFAYLLISTTTLWWFRRRPPEISWCVKGNTIVQAVVMGGFQLHEVVASIFLFTGPGGHTISTFVAGPLMMHYLLINIAYLPQFWLRTAMLVPWYGILYFTLDTAGFFEPSVCLRNLLMLASTIGTHLSLSAMCIRFNEGREQALFRAMANAKSAERNHEAMHEVCMRMLRSLFDAHCRCDELGALKASTPELDRLLWIDLGSGACNLLDYAASKEEEARLRTFLSEVTKSTRAVRVQASLRRRSDFGEDDCIEVNLHGVAIPPEACSSVQKVEIFIGAEVIKGADPPPSAAAAADAACSAIPRGDSALLVDDLPRTPLSEVRGMESLLGPLMGATKSANSAPAVMEGQLRDFVRSATCASGADCLPLDATVWVEGKALPVSLDKVARGERILCYDHLARGLKYAMVFDASIQEADPSNWVQITLADNSTLETTADHPVFPKMMSEDEVTPCGARKAEDLRPAVHCLEVIKMVAVAVKSVEHLQDLPQQTGRAWDKAVKLSVQQPERHSIFAAPGKSGPVGAAGAQGMAVASGNVLPTDGLNWRWTLKNTFVECPLEADEEDESEEQVVQRPPRRALSLPAHFTQATMSSASVSAATPSESILSMGTGTPLSGSDHRTTRIILGSTLADRFHGKENVLDEIRLTNLLRTTERGLPSIGSLHHADGTCCPCLMQHWWQKNRGKAGRGKLPCVFGRLCGRCHEPHTESEVQKARRSLCKSRTSGPSEGPAES